MNPSQLAEQIFRAGVASVLPDKMIRETMDLTYGVLRIATLRFPLSTLGRIYVIGAGKASALMGQAVEDILGDRITDGHIVVKHGHACALSRIQVSEAGHPVPDRQGREATAAILRLMAQTQENDLVICLLSGGGSALLTDYPEKATLADLTALNTVLLNSGANISEINTVRKHLSKVKGGQLARAVYPATLVSLILSDVIGDPLDVIASGPTSADSSTFQDVDAVLRKYQLWGKIPPVFRQHLQQGLAGELPETPKAGEEVFAKTHNLIIGSNSIALQAAKLKAEQLGYQTHVVTAQLTGDAAAAAREIVQLAKRQQQAKETGQKICLLFGGEPTLKVTGKGLGGRNQHLALCAASQLAGTKGITLLAAGTDGTDGPTDAAGAVVDGATIDRAFVSHLNPAQYLQNFDSYHFFAQTKEHIITGSTLTNVMDLIVVLIE